MFTEIKTSYHEQSTTDASLSTEAPVNKGKAKSTRAFGSSKWVSRLELKSQEAEPGHDRVEDEIENEVMTPTELAGAQEASARMID
jgi:hypothetical protein